MPASCMCWFGFIKFARFNPAVAKWANIEEQSLKEKIYSLPPQPLNHWLHAGERQRGASVSVEPRSAPGRAPRARPVRAQCAPRAHRRTLTSPVRLCCKGGGAVAAHCHTTRPQWLSSNTSGTTRSPVWVRWTTCGALSGDSCGAASSSDFKEPVAVAAVDVWIMSGGAGSSDWESCCLLWSETRCISFGATTTKCSRTAPPGRRRPYEASAG